VGYVHTSYATRNISLVLQDVSTYAGWAMSPNSTFDTTGLGVHGIFFDEAPSVYSADAAEYLKTINQAVKNESGLLGDRQVSGLRL